QQGTTGPTALLAPLAEEIGRVGSSAEVAGDDTANDERESAPPVVVDRVDLAVRPPCFAVGRGQVAQLGGRKRLDSSQRPDRPSLAYPLAEREKGARQAPRLLQPSGQQSGKGGGAA